MNTSAIGKAWLACLDDEELDGLATAALGP
jgi:DNA-binding IclR family transcriptional regulator